MKKKLFRKENKIEDFTRLYKHLGSIEYQVFLCVNTIREAKAYLYGALGILERIYNERIYSKGV